MTLSFWKANTFCLLFSSTLFFFSSRFPFLLLSKHLLFRYQLVGCGEMDKNTMEETEGCTVSVIETPQYATSVIEVTRGESV